MNFYSQVSSQWAIDKENKQFVSLAKRRTPYTMDVPFFLWEYKDICDRFPVTGFESNAGTLKNVHSCLKRSLCVELNELRVDFYNVSPFSAGVKFYDKRLSKELSFELDAKPDERVIKSPRGNKLRGISGVDYTLYAGGKTVRYRTDFGPQSPPDQDFRYISGLGKGTHPKKQFSYGVSPMEYTVTYHGEELGGTSLALVCGPWAVLLDDDLSFDTLVLLRGARSGILDVDRFVYTTNLYVLKLMVLRSN